MHKIDAMVVREKNGSFKRESVLMDDPREDEVRVRIVATGMCHTDLIIRSGYAPYPLPFVLGHEGSGIVEQVGSAVAHVAVGDHVVLSFNSCGACRGCESGHEAYCQSFGALNLIGRRTDGSTTLIQEDAPVFGSFFSQSSFATHALASARGVVRVRRDAPLERLGPLGCGIQTGAGAVMNVLQPWRGSSLAVFGAGAVGLSAVMAAKIAGCSRIFAVDPLPSRLDLALELGATDVILIGGNLDASAEILASGGADFSIDTSGIPDSIQKAVACLTRQGSCALVSSGKPGAEVTFAVGQLTGGRRILGVIEGDSRPQTFIPKLVDLYMEGRLPFDRLIRFYDFEEINQAAQDSLSGATVKPVIRVSSASQQL